MKCIKIHGRVVSVSTCLARQNAKISFTSGFEYLECVNCEQGRLAREGKLNDDDIDEMLERARAYADKIINQVGKQNPNELEMGPQKLKPTSEDRADVQASIRNVREAATHKACRSCGELKPITEFYKHNSTEDKKDPRCKTCRKALARKYYALQKERSTEGDKSEDHGASDEATEDYVIRVDLSEYPEIHEAIRKLAKREERTPEGQVRYWLRNHVRIEGGEAIMTCEKCFREIDEDMLLATYSDEDKDVIEVRAQCQVCGTTYFRYIDSDEFDWE